jgi:glutaredoxin 2
MGLILYHYVHCPFCIRVRLALGYLSLQYESKVLAYNDAETPTRLTGKKMLPILAFDKGIMNESLDIIAFLDRENKLITPDTTHSSQFKDFETFLSSIAGPIHSLAMPYWIYTPEFTAESRHYFKQKKEEKRGPFKDLVCKQQEFKNQLDPLLHQIEKRLQPFYLSHHFSVYDIMLASHLWGLYIVPEFQFSTQLNNYLQKIKNLCHFNYHQDFWN